MVQEVQCRRGPIVDFDDLAPPAGGSNSAAKALAAMKASILESPATVVALGKPSTGVAVMDTDREVHPVEGDPSRQRAVITRKLQGDRMYVPGEVIEVEAGLRRRALMNDRRIRDLRYGEDLFACACGHVWVGRELAQRHACEDEN